VEWLFPLELGHRRHDVRRPALTDARGAFGVGDHTRYMRACSGREFDGEASYPAARPRDEDTPAQQRAADT